MAVIKPREDVGTLSAWMRQSLLVAALAGAGEDGAEADVPGSTLLARHRF
jgi:hypothetical protein